MVDALRSDLRFTARMIRKNPGFSAIAITTLALGIGVNTAIFSLVDHIILRPLAYRNPDRLYAVQEAVPSFRGAPPVVPVNAAHFLEWRKHVSGFQSAALLGGEQFDLTGAGEPVRVAAARVSWNLFNILGVTTQLGRTFRPEEDQPGRDREVIINHELWKGRFAGDPNILGRKILLDGEPYEVIGVLPANFRFPKLAALFDMTISEERPEIWKPFGLRKDELDDLGDFNYSCIVRLKPGFSSARALAELNAVENDIARRLPEKVELRGILSPLQTQITGRSRSGLELVLMAVGSILLIACVNIANLLLARASVRSREMAVRTALGASRIRLLRQTLVETLALALSGGALGLCIAYAAMRIVIATAPVDLPRLDEVQLDAGVLLFTLAVSILCGLFFGMLGAFASVRHDPQGAMKAGGRGTTDSRAGGRIRSALVSAEVCLSVISLLTGALLLHSFMNLLNVHKGFNVQRVLTVHLTLPDSRYPGDEKKVQFVKGMLDRIAILPGIHSAAIGGELPLTGEGDNNVIQVEGSILPIMQRPLVDIRRISPAYFQTLEIPLHAGRVFAAFDERRNLAVVSQSAAAKLWPRESAIGKRFHLGDDKRPWLQVLGVVGDIRGASLNAPPSPTVYLPYWLLSSGEPNLVVKTTLAQSAAAAEIRKTLHELDPQMPVQNFQTMQEILDDSVAQRSFQMRLILLFALSALLLASLGVYGVVSYSVAQRTSEIGIRMTLGAQRGDIGHMVLWQGLLPAMVGLAAGMVASYAVGRAIAGLLFRVGVADPFAMGTVLILLVSVVLLATFLPAIRATRVDPVTALRYE